MELRFYQIDAFTDTLFKGNPACVVPLERWLPDKLLLKIAKENAVPETAFFVEEDLIQNHLHLHYLKYMLVHSPLSQLTHVLSFPEYHKGQTHQPL